ncbi:MAG TPA: protein phosphatase 2C domain-containing protein [Woeseiaceae bacterium]|nr:protein phosphatase 2C domain-containing protein [Woeseiaceae bacterium]
MSDGTQDFVVLDGATTADRKVLDAGGGTLVAFTVRAPDKASENEDTVAVIPWGPAAAVLIVADGAGGLPAGKRASLTAVYALRDSLQVALEKTTLLRTAVLNGIEAANAAVRELGNGSATTLTVVTVEGRLARSYQIGDSEAIVVGQRGRVKMQTTAHSPTGFAVEAGFLDQRAALHHAERHLVSNFIGAADMRIDMSAGVELDARDTVILASDGLTDNLHLEEIVELVRKGPLSAAADRVIEKAARRMQDEKAGQPSKPDDLSLILFRKPPRRTGD